MKVFFRFMRGELNGFYLNAVMSALESFASYVCDFMALYRRMSLLDYDTLLDGVLLGLGRFTGTFLPFENTDAPGSFSWYMTESHFAGGKQRSERGLLRMSDMQFVFEHTGQDDYPADINTLATPALRSGMAGPDDAVTGYIRNDAGDVLRPDYTVDPAKVLPSPPQDVGYTEYYGDQFMFLGDGRLVQEQPSNELYLLLIRAMQYINYNGETLAGFVRIMEIICGEPFVKITGIRTRFDGTYIVSYEVHGTQLPDMRQRLFLMRYVLGQKYPDVTLEETVV